MERITVTVLKWEKYNPRKDIKHPNWFALSNRFLEDPDIFALEPMEFKALLYIFSQASQKNSSTVTLVIAHADRVCGISSKVLFKTLEKLSNIGTVRICTDDERARTQTSRDTTIQDTTNKTEQTHTTEPAAQFDFGKAFSLYPLKIKGTDAEKRFKIQIKTEKDEAELHQATKNYVAMLATESWRRPKQTYSAFLGTKSSGFFWRDFITWAPPIAGPTETKEERVARLIKEREGVAS